VRDLESIELVVPSARHLRIVLDDPEEADAAELLDASGERLNLSFMRGGVTFGSQAVGIEDGVSNPIGTDDSARTLVLFKGGLEVRRLPVALRPGEVNEIRP
jgi:hypothetical protein